MIKRLIIDVFLFLGIFIFPWWFVFICAGCALFYFSSFYEILFLGIIVDSLYNAPIVAFLHVEFVVTILAIILFIFSEVLKRRLRIYGR